MPRFSHVISNERSSPSARSNRVTVPARIRARIGEPGAARILGLHGEKTFGDGQRVPGGRAAQQLRLQPTARAQRRTCVATHTTSTPSARRHQQTGQEPARGDRGRARLGRDQLRLKQHVTGRGDARLGHEHIARAGGKEVGDVEAGACASGGSARPPRAADPG